ncbi:MAG: sodium-dependent transporter [Oscillospiraceae bacterium]|nr:sodium-dependent transporter [Oscillospiraceae bacterium]
MDQVPSSTNQRGSFGSNIGFLLSAIGSAVGLGNIWGFPYKMGKCGGFTFLLIYLALAVFVGFAIMMGELALGRKTGLGPVNAYKAISKKFKWVGWLAVAGGFFVLTFYMVLGGYCIYYVIINLIGIFGGMPDSSSFGAMITNRWLSIGITLLFFVICWAINRGGVAGGIEKFNKIGMPALFVMLVIIIIKALTMPHAMEGLKFMFVPGYATKVTEFGQFVESTPSLLAILATAGGQMFFSLSLGMSAMITYGSYLSKKENLPKNSVIIVFADTLIAILAGVAVIPAAVANGIAQGLSVSEIKLNGPGLLFSTLQDVFHNMGALGGVFGVIFYVLVLIAAISSAISVIEGVAVTFIDRASAKGKEPSRTRAITLTCVVLFAFSFLVAVDGLGSNNIAPWQVLKMSEEAIRNWNVCWLDFFDLIAEGILMPLGAMLMACMIGWELKPSSFADEIKSGSNGGSMGFWSFCIKYICPVVMFFIVLVQVSDFFGLGWF